MASQDKRLEVNFEEMWEQAAKKFEQKTSKNLRGSRDRSLEEAIGVLREKFDAQDPDSGGRQQRIKELATNVLKFIQLLGGIAAQGASMVFGPATLCFNAVQFLMDIPAKISKFYADLEQLFGKISTFLTQFKIFRRIEQFPKVDMDLKECVNQVLVTFVDALAISINILGASKWKHVVHISKLVLFDHDSGIHDTLKEFERLTLNQSRVIDGVTLENVLESKHGIDMLKQSADIQSEMMKENSWKLDNIYEGVLVTKDMMLDATNDRRKRAQGREQIDLICEKLDTTRDRALESEKAFQQTRAQVFKDTGDWLETIDSYQKWVDLESDANSVLVLSGDNGCGKTYLASAILDSQRNYYEIQDTKSKRVTVACYSFDKNDKPSRESSSKNTRQPVMALKSMALQIATRDNVYAQRLFTYLKPKDPSFLRDVVAKDLINELFPPPNMEDTADFGFILILDGLDQLALEDARQLTTSVLAIRSPKVRVVITATEKTLEDCSEESSENFKLVPKIRVSEYNNADIQRHIESELNSKEDLNSEEPSILRIVGLIREQLPKIANGNFNNVKQVISNVAKAVASEEDVKDIEECISVENLEDRDEKIRRIISELSTSLNAQEIEQLNELLLWTIYGIRWMSVDEMRAAVLQRTKRAPHQKLERKIRQKYNKILEVDGDNDIVVRDWGFCEFFESSKWRRHEEELEKNAEPTVSMTIRLNNVELPKAQRFFWDLSEKMMFDKFSFATPSTDFRKVVISANPAESHLTLTNRCLSILLDDVTEENKVLGRYAVSHLPSHLRELRNETNLASLTLAEKQQIVRNLVSLLRSAECFERHLNEGFLHGHHWVNDDFAPNAVQEWLRDFDAIGQLSRSDRAWVESNTCGHPLLPLQGLATMVARHWLCERIWTPESLFSWIDGFIEQKLVSQDKAENEESESKDPAEHDSEEMTAGDEPKPNVTIEQKSPSARVRRAVEWVEKEIKDVAKNSLWHERLGATYLRISEPGLAKEAFLNAKNRPECSWRVSEGLAQAYDAQDDKKEAVREMENAFAYLRAKNDLSEDEREDFIADLLKSADWQTELHNTTGATERLAEAVGLDPLSYPSYYRLLALYMESGQGSMAIAVLKDMSAQPSAEKTLTRLGSMMLEFSNWDEPQDCFETLFRISKHDEMFFVVLETLQAALTFAQNSNKNSHVVDLLISHGVALARHSDEEKNLELALARWMDCCKIGFQSNYWKEIFSGIWAARYVFNYHFSNARSTSSLSNEFRNHMVELEELTKKAGTNPLAAQPLRLSLASFYSLAGEQEQARNLLLNDMKVGFDLLCDDDPTNDYYAYGQIANILMHVGDDLNSLSAWSLFGPDERYHDQEDGSPSQPQSSSDKEILDGTGNSGEVQGGQVEQPSLEKDLDKDNASSEAGKSEEEEESVPASAAPKKKRKDSMPFRCDGRCQNSWTYQDSIWFCKVCDDVQFDDQCLQKLQNGTLKRFVCSRDHSWLRVPSWVEEFEMTGKGHVRMGGELQDGKRAGGQIVPVAEWEDAIREKWGIEKPSREPSIKANPENGGNVGASLT
ncbi:hypothetical protein EV356DRAFT_457297 [Viridothelium virens]|uniref:Uncharacterized protein n=1 Tax=Viridothelium virens TaxID=1048519 RepID=A0A6A6GSB8_VIRVR|nr:hypothetical protein EV356DRAFT_457297 [Viridothelium virens]